MFEHIKRIIKLIISLSFFVFDYISRWLRSLFNKDTTTCVILYYHAVYPEEKEAFTLQIDDLLRWTKPIAINEIGSLKQGERYCSVTFDDGFTCVREYALPVLSNLNIPATLFVPSACLGQQPPWLDEKHIDRKNVVMTEEQLKSLDKKLVTIGSHGRTHQNLLKIGADEARKEIIQSKKELEDILNMSIETISFPHGDFNQTHIEMAIQAGYQHAYSIIPELICKDDGNFIRGRVKADPSDWRVEYRLKLLGAYRWLPIAFLLKQKMRCWLKENNFYKETFNL